jgi:hypothetical protein
LLNSLNTQCLFYRVTDHGSNVAKTVCTCRHLPWQLRRSRGRQKKGIMYLSQRKNSVFYNRGAENETRFRVKYFFFVSRLLRHQKQTLQKRQAVRTFPNFLHTFWGKRLLQLTVLYEKLLSHFCVTAYFSRGMHPELCDFIAKNSDAKLELQTSIPALR